MERDCLTGSTLITLTEGVSVRIDNMFKRNYNVLGYSQEKNGLIDSLQSHFLHKGKKECLKLTLEDGKTISSYQEFIQKNNEIKQQNIELLKIENAQIVRMDVFQYINI